jgi:adhesin transport system membrane fusion protein
MNSRSLAPLTSLAVLHAQTLEDQERRTSRWLMLIIALLLVVGVVWAALFKIEEVTKGVGKVIPASREQVIQSLDPGVLADMHVREGDRVTKGQVLLRIDDVRSGSVYREAQEKWMALSAQAARLRAEAYGAGMNYPHWVQQRPELVKRESLIYQSRRQALEDELVAMKESMTHIQREIAITEPLVGQGVLSEVELLRLRRQQADLQTRLSERQNRYATEASTELARIESELAQTRQNSLAREDAFRRTVIRAPMDGIVKNVQVTTLGAVVASGQNIMEIVPVQDAMLVEAYVKPSEIAFLEVNQPATVKLTAYEFSKYGGLEGVVEHLSPDTLKDESKVKRPGEAPVDLEEGFYRVLIRVTDKSLERHGKKIQTLPGMTASIEIKTGEKTVLEYLWRPLKNLSQALKER